MLSVQSWCRTPEVLEGSRLPEAWATPALSPSRQARRGSNSAGSENSVGWLCLENREVKGIPLGEVKDKEPLSTPGPTALA